MGDPNRKTPIADGLQAFGCLIMLLIFLLIAGFILWAIIF